MCGDSFFRYSVHFRSANLNLKRLTARYHRRVQRLITIGPRQGNEILDSTGHGPPRIVNDAQSGVTILDVVCDNAKGEEVVHLIDGNALLSKLYEDGIQPLHARFYTAGNTMFLHL